VSPPNISDLRLERLALGELAPPEARRLRALIAQDPDAAARLEAIERSDGPLLRMYPPDAVHAEIMRRLGAHEDPPASRARPAWAMAFAGALVAAFLLAPPGTEAPSGQRTKGAMPGLQAYRVQMDGAQRLDSGAPARAGDRIQLAVVGAQGLYAVVVSIDDPGAVTLHYPRQGDVVAPLTQPRQALPRSFELDDAREFERFHVVTSAAPLDIDTVVDSVRSSGGQARLPALPDGARQATFLLRKTP